jgi:hypothetical protein
MERKGRAPSARLPRAAPLPPRHPPRRVHARSPRTAPLPSFPSVRPTLASAGQAHVGRGQGAGGRGRRASEGQGGACVLASVAGRGRGSHLRMSVLSGVRETLPPRYHSVHRRRSEPPTPVTRTPLPASHTPTPRGYAECGVPTHIGHGMSTHPLLSAPNCHGMSTPHAPTFTSKARVPGISGIAGSPIAAPLSRRYRTAHRAWSATCTPAAHRPFGSKACSPTCLN